MAWNLVFSNNPIKSLWWFPKEIIGNVYFSDSIISNDDLENFLKNISLFSKIKWDILNVTDKNENHEENLNFIYREKYDVVYEFRDWIAVVFDKWKYWFINIIWEIIIPIIYDDISNFSDWVSSVKLKKKYWYINKTWTTVLPFQYSYALNFYDWVWIILDNDKKYHFIDKLWNLVSPHYYNQADDFSDGLSKVIYDRHYWFVDKTWNMVIEPMYYNQIFSFSDWYALIENRFKWWFIDTTWKFVISKQYDKAESFSEWLASVYQYEIGYQFIDKSWNVVKTIDHIPNLQSLGSFHSWCARIGIWTSDFDKELWFIDKNYEICIPAEYSWGARDFKNWIAVVYKNNKRWYLYTDGYVKWM